MQTAESPQNELGILKNAPSEEAWEIEIRRVLNKERYSLVERLGGVEEHISVLLRDSSDPIDAEVKFRHGLDQVVSSWQPTHFHTDYYTAAILDLIGAFIPRSAFDIILAYMIEGGFFAENTSRRETGRRRNLHQKALYVLEKYVPTSPLYEQIAFNNYVRMLQALSDNPMYMEYVKQRLSTLGLNNRNEITSQPFPSIQTHPVAVTDVDQHHGMVGIFPSGIGRLKDTSNPFELGFNPIELGFKRIYCYSLDEGFINPIPGLTVSDIDLQLNPQERYHRGLTRISKPGITTLKDMFGLHHRSVIFSVRQALYNNPMLLEESQAVGLPDQPKSATQGVSVMRSAYINENKHRIIGKKRHK